LDQDGARDDRTRKTATAGLVDTGDVAVSEVGQGLFQTPEPAEPSSLRKETGPHGIVERLKGARPGLGGGLVRFASGPQSVSRVCGPSPE
jgi:hypothetical protein